MPGEPDIVWAVVLQLQRLGGGSGGGGTEGWGGGDRSGRRSWDSIFHSLSKSPPEFHKHRDTLLVQSRVDWLQFVCYCEPG